MSIELPVATRHCRDMIEKLFKATLNPNKQQQQNKGCAHYTGHSRHTNQTRRFDPHVLSSSMLRDRETCNGFESLLRHIYLVTDRDTRRLTCIASDVRSSVWKRDQDNINTGPGVRRIVFKRQEYMYKSKPHYIIENLLTRNARARTHTAFRWLFAKYTN